MPTRISFALFAVFAFMTSAAVAGGAHKGGPRHHRWHQSAGWDHEDKWSPVDSLVARWWQSYLSIPTPVRNALGETVEACGLGQSGDTWLLAQTGTPFEPVTRQCVVPKGTTLFIPVITIVCIPYPGETIGDNIQFCREAVDTIDQLSVTVDGKNRNGLITRRAQSKAFPVWLPEENYFELPPEDIPAGTYSAVAEGFYVQLKLPPGKHVIRAIAGSTTENPNAPIYDATYEIDVQKPTYVTPR